jgi:ABC-type sugar transport system substrate-binding protein
MTQILEQTLEKNKKIMGLILPGSVNPNLDELIKQTSLTGRPVVMFAADNLESGRDGFVGFDENLSGKMLGQLLYKNSSSDKKLIIVVTKSTPEDKIQLQRLNALRNQLYQHAGTKIIKTIEYSNDDKLASELSENIRKAPTLFAVIATGDWVVSPKVLKSLLDYRGKIFAIANTPSAIAAIKTDRVSGLVVQDIYSASYLAAKLCFSKLRGNISRDPNPLPPIPITSSDIGPFLKKWGKSPVTTSDDLPKSFEVK